MAAVIEYDVPERSRKHRLKPRSTASRNSVTGRNKTISSDRRLSDSTVPAVMRVPLEKVNIADWLLTLPDAEHQRCSHAHIAAGTSTTDDGRTMSINVETICDALIVQHYVAKLKEPALDRGETPNFAASIERHALKQT
jgi:hypothetical protein